MAKGSDHPSSGSGGESVINVRNQSTIHVEVDDEAQGGGDHMVLIEWFFDEDEVDGH